MLLLTKDRMRFGGETLQLEKKKLNAGFNSNIPSGSHLGYMRNIPNFI